MDERLWKQQLSRIIDEGVGLTAWEEEFIDDLFKRVFTDNLPLSVNQAGKLQNIYDKRVL